MRQAYRYELNPNNKQRVALMGHSGLSRYAWNWRFMPSSKTCSQCGAIKTNLTLKDRTYKCTECGLSIGRDLNAAINLKNYGLKQVAARFSETQNVCGGEIRPVNMRANSDEAETHTGSPGESEQNP